MSCGVGQFSFRFFHRYCMTCVYALSVCVRVCVHRFVSIFQYKWSTLFSWKLNGTDQVADVHFTFIFQIWKCWARRKDETKKWERVSKGKKAREREMHRERNEWKRSVSSREHEKLCKNIKQKFPRKWYNNVIWIFPVRHQYSARTCKVFLSDLSAVSSSAVILFSFWPRLFVWLLLLFLFRWLLCVCVCVHFELVFECVWVGRITQIN